MENEMYRLQMSTRYKTQASLRHLEPIHFICEMYRVQMSTRDVSGSAETPRPLRCFKVRGNSATFTFQVPWKHHDLGDVSSSVETQQSLRAREYISFSKKQRLQMSTR